MSIFANHLNNFVSSDLDNLFFMLNKIKCSWKAVATWKWIANDDSCGICRMPFDACCPDCKIPGDDCPLGDLLNNSVYKYLFFYIFMFVNFNLFFRKLTCMCVTYVTHHTTAVWGQCSHCFHIHCIVKWLNSQQTHQQCPMCRREWKFKE